VAPGIEGLVHISEISDQHVDSPESVLSVGDEVRVKVIEVEVARRRVSLSMRQVGGALPTPRETEIEEEAVSAGAETAPPAVPSEELASAAPEIAPAEAATAGGAGSASVEIAPVSDEAAAAAASETPAEDATASPEAAAPDSAPQADASEEDVSLEAILEDLKRREGRSE
jgi:small subunit ribosomal protein S1